MAVQRERLRALLVTVIPQSVVLVVAPPAYGKTTLLLDYLQADRAAKLVTASANEPDLESFVRDIIAVVDPKSLRSIGALFDQRATTGFRDTLRAWLLGRLRRVSGTIVIDDLQRFSGDAAAMWLLQEAIENTAGRLRWIIATRESSGLPVGTWVARGIMGLPITEDDLAFTQDEASLLAVELGVAISEDDLATLLKDTNGWPLGLRLSLELSRRTPNLGPIKFRTRDVLFRYLDDAVWKMLPQSAHEPLYACAILPSVSIAVLRAAGFTDAAAILGDLQARVPFVQRRHDDTFILHDLFREYVQQRLACDVLGQTLAPRLAEQLVANAREADAVSLLTTAQCVPELCATLASCAFHLIETGHRGLVERALGFLSGTAAREDPAVLAVRGALALSDGSGENAAALLETALQGELPVRMRAECASRLTSILLSAGKFDRALEVISPLLGDADLDRNDRLLIQSICAGAFAAAGRSEPARGLIERLVPKLRTAAPETRAIALTRLGSAAFYIGDLAGAEEYASDAAALCHDLGMESVAAHAYGTLCGVAVVSDRTCLRALAFAKQQASSAERAGNVALRVVGLRAQLDLAAESGDFEAAQAADVALLALPDTRTHRDALPTRIARALLWASRDEPKRAAALVASASDRALSPPERAYRNIFAGLLSLIDGDRETARLAIEKPLLLEATENYIDRRYAALTYAFRGIVLWALDRPAQARRAFAMDTTFLAERDHVLIEALRAVTALPHPLPNPTAFDWICDLLATASLDGYSLLLRKLARRETEHVVLTPAELETLRAFEQLGQTTAQIAAHLGKSYHTVDTQVKTIIRKLGCSGRAEALAFARKQGWL